MSGGVVCVGYEEWMKSDIVIEAKYKKERCLYDIREFDHNKNLFEIKQRSERIPFI